MELVKKDGEPETKPEAEMPTEEQNEVALMQALVNDYVKAEGYAKMIHGKTIGQWFTLHRCAQLLSIPVNKVQELIGFLSQFYFMERKQELGVYKYHIQLDAQERMKGTRIRRQQLKEEIAIVDTIAAMLIQEIDDKKPN